MMRFISFRRCEVCSTNDVCQITAYSSRKTESEYSISITHPAFDLVVSLLCVIDVNDKKEYAKIKNKRKEKEKIWLIWMDDERIPVDGNLCAIAAVAAARVEPMMRRRCVD